MTSNKILRIGKVVIVILLAVFLFTKVAFLLTPIWLVIKTLFLPFMLAGIFYYLLRPAVHVLVRRKVNKSLAIVLLYLVLFGIILFIILEIIPMITTQLNNLVSSIPDLVQLVKDQVSKWQENTWVAAYMSEHQIDLSSKISEYANGIISDMGNAFNTLIRFISSFVVLLSTVPFILFYMLKEEEKISAYMLRRFPDPHKEEGKQIVHEMDSALSAYIQGKILVSLLLGVLIFVGYSIIGLQYSLLLALAAALMNVIPFVGLFIGIIPSVVVSFIYSPIMLLKVIIVVLIAQQIESNFLSPQIMGKKLDIHPLTIILLLIVVGTFSGLLGMFLAIPAYAVIKVIASHLYRLYILRRKKGLS